MSHPGPGPLAVGMVRLAALATLLLCGQGGARADTSSGRVQAIARGHFVRGERLYLKDQYADALLEFEAGYAALPLPGFLVNIGQCRRRLGDPGAAREAYEKFLARAPGSPLAPAVRELVQALTLAPPHFEPTAPAPPRMLEQPIAFRSMPAEPRSIGFRAEPASFLLPAAVAVESPGETDQPSRPDGKVTSHRGWWLWGAVAVATIAAGALVIGSASAGGTTTTIHDGTIGTLRR